MDSLTTDVALASADGKIVMAYVVFIVGAIILSFLIGWMFGRGDMDGKP